jgi:membrane protease YdiL (CAAX protease family)
MSQAGGVSTTSELGESNRLNAAKPIGDWRESVLVFVMVLLPVPLASIFFAVGVSVTVGWHWLYSQPFHISAKASMISALSLYAVISWIDVALVWRSSSRRGFSRDVFIFRRPTWPDVATGLAGFAIAMYGVPLLTRWLSHVTSGHGPVLPLDDAASLAVYILCIGVTAAICEDVLYRGLLVAWFSRVGWRTPVIWLVGSLLFGASHLLFTGFVWSAAMVLFGAMLFGLRLWRHSLTPGLLAHFLFNAQLVIHPLISWLAPALRP